MSLGSMPRVVNLSLADDIRNLPVFLASILAISTSLNILYYVQIVSPLGQITRMLHKQQFNFSNTFEKSFEKYVTDKHWSMQEPKTSNIINDGSLINKPSIS